MKLEIASFDELKNELEGKWLTDEQLDALAENEGVWWELISRGIYECRDLSTPAGEKQDVFNFHYEVK